MKQKLACLSLGLIVAVGCGPAGGGGDAGSDVSRSDVVANDTGVTSDSSPGDGGGDSGSGFQFTTANASTWASLSAPNMLFISTAPLFSGVNSGDPSCPTQSTSGSQTTVMGGCTDSNGTMYTGSITFTGTAASLATTLPSSITYTHWSTTTTCMGQSEVDTIDGTVTSTVAGGTTSFMSMITAVGNGVNVSSASGGDGGTSCTVTAGTMGTITIAYAGTYTGSLMTGTSSPPSTWNGTGTFSGPPEGSITATTHDELINGMACQYTPMSGTTTVTNGGHTAVITYQGATTCDMTATAAWTLDGAAQPNLTGIACSAGPIGAGRGSLAALGAFAAVALVASRRRRHRRA